MELREDDEMLECEKEKNKNKYLKRELHLTIDGKNITVFVFTKIQIN